MTIRIEDGYAQWVDLKTNTTFIRTAGNVLLHEIVRATTNLSIEAHVVTVVGAVDLKGYSIDIRCMLLSGGKDAKITSTGQTGAGYSLGIKPSPSSEFGQDGFDGEPGSQGIKGGDIFIVANYAEGDIEILSVGGQGGRGQDGGDGTSGKTGLNGADKYIRPDVAWPNKVEYSGGTGEIGGRVGLPGINGIGGNSGSLSVGFVRESSHLVNCSSIQGASGEDAKPGVQGEGGNGGIPGTLTEIRSGGFDIESIENLSKSMPSYSLSTSLQPQKGAIRRPPIYTHLDTGEAGKRGADGDSRVTEVSARQKFIDRVNTPVAIRKIKHNDIKFSELFYEMFVCSVEDSFRKNGTLDVLEVEGVEYYLNCIQSLVSPKPTELEHFNRMYLMIFKASRGLDYFGFSKEQISVFSVHSVSQYFERLLPSAKIIDELYQRLINRVENNDLVIESLSKAKGDLSTLSVNLNQDLESAKNNLIVIQKEFSPMLQAIDMARIDLLNAHDDLKAAAAGKGCDWESTLMAVGVIAVGIYTAGAGYAAAASAAGTFVDTWNENNKSLETLWDAKELLQSDSKKFVDPSKDVANAFSEIQSAIKGLNEATIQASLPAIEVSQDHFDQIYQQYSELPQASVYKDRGYQYISRIETRHKAIAAYEAAVVRLSALASKAKTAQNSVNAIDDAIKNGDVVIATLMQSVWSMRRSSLEILGELLHAQSKSIKYHFGETVTPKIDTNSLATLSATYLRLQNDWLDLKENVYPKRRSNKEIRIPISEYSNDAEWSLFSGANMKSRTILFSIDPYKWPTFVQGDGTRQVTESAQTLSNFDLFRVTNFAIEIKLEMKNGIEQKVLVPSGVKWHLMHSGREMMLFDRKVIASFTRFPEVKKGDLGNTFDSDMSEDGLYSGMSPFSHWQLWIDDPYENIPSKIERVELVVKGYVVG